jgi:Sel1 repeat
MARIKRGRRGEYTGNVDGAVWPGGAGVDQRKRVQRKRAAMRRIMKRMPIAGLWLALAGGAVLAAQSADQNSGVDPAVLSKANAGDAVAEVQAGESCAAAHELAQAAAWYTKAAGQGSISGEIHLAVLYRDGGKGVARDMTQAAEWYRKAAEQGDAAAQATLGMLYMLGQGVARSDVEAYYWLDLAASVKGPNQAQYAANRQVVGTRITIDELAGVEDRVAKWKAAHPRPDSLPDSN